MLYRIACNALVQRDWEWLIPTNLEDITYKFIIENYLYYLQI